MNNDFLWPSARAAQDALLQFAGNPPTEQAVTRNVTLAELAHGLPSLAPAVVDFLDTHQAVAVFASGRVLTKDGAPSRARWEDVRKLWEEPARERERLIFAPLPIASSAAGKVINERIATQPVATVTHYAAPPGSSFCGQLASTGWLRRLSASITVHAAAYAIGIAAWALIAQAALSGRWDTGWFWGWVILFAIGMPLEAFSAWWQGCLSLTLGGLLKQRMLAGSLEVDSDKIRHQGVGQLMGRVLESSSLESLSLTGGAATFLCGVELVRAIVVLSLGAMPLVCVALFSGWITLVGLVAWQAALERKAWMLQRNRLTHDLIEKMNGHRTRIAQQPPSLWHAEEDSSLVAYLPASVSLDRLNALLTAVAPRAWLTLGMAAVGYAFITHARPKLRWRFPPAAFFSATRRCAVLFSGWDSLSARPTPGPWCGISLTPRPMQKPTIRNTTPLFWPLPK